MIEKITVYQTTDGKRFDSLEAAEEYEKLYQRCEKLHEVLGAKATCRYAIKHDPLLVRHLFLDFLDLCAQTIDDEIGVFIGVRHGEIHKSHAERILSDYHHDYPCLWDTYFRFNCIGPSGIEYEQPYYAYHEDKWDGAVKAQ